MKISKKLFWSIIILLVSCIGGLGIFAAFWRHRAELSPVQTFIHDTVTITKSAYIPKPTNVYVPLAVPQVVDTLEILNDYFTTRTYTDTIIQTNQITVIVNDTVFEDKIISRDFNVIYNEVQTVEKQKVKNWQFGLGAYIANPVDKFHLDLSPS